MTATEELEPLVGLQRRLLAAPLNDVLTGLLARAARLTNADGACLDDPSGTPYLTYGVIEPALEQVQAPVLTIHDNLGVLTAVRTRPEPFCGDAAETVALVAEAAAAAVLASQAAARDELAAVRAETLTRIHESKDQLRALIDSTPLGVALVRGNDFALIRSNEALAKLAAVPVGALSSMTLLDLAPVAERHEFRSWLRALTPAKSTATREMRLLRADGEPLWTRVFGAVVIGAAPEQIVVQVEDIALQWKAQQLLSRLAHNDPLTGLANRNQVMRQLDSALSRAGSEEICLLYLDLDGFKDVNDRLGHSAGDELLVNLADRLAASVRPRDVVGRLGGDEFVVVLDHVVDLAEVEQMTNRLRDVISDDVELANGEHVQVSASIGVSTARPGDSPASLIDRADQSMYAEKRQHHLDVGQH